MNVKLVMFTSVIDANNQKKSDNKGTACLTVIHQTAALYSVTASIKQDWQWLKAQGY